MTINKRTLLALSLLQIASYFLLIQLIALRLSTSFDAVVLDLAGDLFARALSIPALVIGLSIIYLTPGLLWISKHRETDLHELLIKSLLLSIVLYTVAFSALKLVFSLELSRTWMLLTCLGITAAWAILDKRQFELNLTGAKSHSLYSGGLTILFLVILLHGKIFAENFSGDGTESFEFSRSLKTKTLPYWDLENGHWGFHPRFMVFAYTNVLSILHLGEIEASARLPFFVFLLAIYLLMAALIKHESRSSKLRVSDSWFLSGAIVVFVISNVFYSTWHPYFADIAEPTQVDTLVTFYFLSAILAWLRRQEIWFLLCCLLTSLSVASGLVLTFFLFLACFLLAPNKKRTGYLALSFLMIYLGYLGLVTIYDKFHPLGHERWSLQGMLGYFGWSDLLDPRRYLPHLKYLSIMTAVTPVLLFPFITKGDRLSAKIYLVSILYVSGVLLFADPNPHYFTSVALLFFIPFWRAVDSMEGRQAGHLKCVYAAVAMIVIFLTFPFGYTLNQDARALGNQTCFEASDYRAQVGLAASIYRLFPFKKYGVGHHTLVYYSAKGNCFGGTYNYILTTKRPPLDNRDDFTRMDGTRLFMRRGIEMPNHPGNSYDGNYRYILKEVYAGNR